MRLEVVEREGLLDLAAQLAERPEAGDQHDRQRAEVADDQPPHRAGQQGPRLEARATVEEVGEPTAHRPPRRRGCRPGCLHESSSASRVGLVLALDLRPPLDPVVVGLADLAAVVAAVRDRSRPVVDLVEVLLVIRVVDLAVLRVCGRESHAFALAGASPNHSATWACTFGSMMWFIHMYMQFGCSASRADHPRVRPSGRALVRQDRLDLARRRPASSWLITCQVVPISLSPLENA